MSDYESALYPPLIALVAGLIYFIPSWIVWNRPNPNPVMVINYFLGWTFIGWVIALAMALDASRSKAS